MPTKLVLDKQQLKTIEQMMKDGAVFEEIANRVGCHVNTMRNHRALPDGWREKILANARERLSKSRRLWNPWSGVKMKHKV